MKTFNVKPVGHVKTNEGRFFIELNSEYIPAIKQLGEFSHINVLWWFHQLDKEEHRNVLEVKAPYKNSPEVMGVFATRSPMRPNPIALTACQIIELDEEKGHIYLAYIDAEDNSPVLDIKPYTPSLDLVSSFLAPDWCAHWPKSLEESESFNWEEEFNF